MKSIRFWFRHRPCEGGLERALILLCIVSVLMAATGSAGARESCNPLPRVEAFLADGHDRIPWGMEPVGKALAAEFRRLEVELVWSTGDDPMPDRKVVFVTILPHAPTDWGVSRMALGGVRQGEAGSSPVFIFYPTVEQMLGAPRSAGSIVEAAIPPPKWILGLSRIIAHEILHVLLPGKPHDSVGLFASNLTRKTLLSKELELEQGTRSALAERLCSRTALARSK